MAVMRAKLKVTAIEQYSDSQSVTFNAVGSSSYPSDGTDENNTYARWTPSAECKMLINNPNLLGKFAIGKEFYVDFTEVN